MELYALDRMVPVAKAHDGAVFQFGSQFEAVRKAGPVDDQRVVARRLKR